MTPADLFALGYAPEEPELERELLRCLGERPDVVDALVVVLPVLRDLYGPVRPTIWQLDTMLDGTMTLLMVQVPVESTSEMTEELDARLGRIGHPAVRDLCVVAIPEHAP